MTARLSGLHRLIHTFPGRAVVMTSKRSVRCVAKSTLPSVTLTATPPSVGVRACGCAHRFLPTLPLHSQSAPVLARRRSRSSTGSSSKSARSVSSGRNTPSPSPIQQSSLKHKAMSESHLADIAAPHIPSTNRIEESDRSEPQPIYFTTSVLIRLSPNKQHFLEQVKYEMRYGLAPSQDELASTDQTQQFRTELEIQVDNPTPVEPNSNQT